MQTPIEVSLHALNLKTLLALIVFGVAPLLLAFVVTVVMCEGRPAKGVALVVILVAALVLGIGVWQLASIRLRVDDASLTLGGGFYRISIPLDRLADGGAQAERVQHYDVGMRTNGIGMPGLSLGWFALGKGGKAFVAITDPDNVVRIPTQSGYTILVSTDESDALVERLQRR